MEYLYANWEVLLIAFVLIVASSCLNRLRGTGLLYHFGTIKNLEKYTFNKVSFVKINLVWNHMYGFFLAIILGYITGSSWIGFLTFIVYLIGESKGWGEWVGTLTTPREEITMEWLKQRYIDQEGKGFPFIFSIANFFIKEQIVNDYNLKSKTKQYLRHVTLALILRGMYWWSLVYSILYYYDYINLIEYITIFISLGLIFPVACYLGSLTNVNRRFFIISCSVGWENQELYYGMFHGIALSYVVLNILNMI